MPAQPIRRGSYESLIPHPLDVAPGDGEFLLTEATTLVILEEASADDAAELLQGYLGPATGLNLPLEHGGSSAATGGAIVFTSDGASGLGPEEYEVRIEAERVEIVAAEPAGFRWAVQTLRQLLPPQIEGDEEQPGTWALPAGSIRDAPRFEWRGAMLDVARHFFPVEDVKSVVDLLASYKMNRLHLHLSDDQGWRIEIAAHPELTDIGARTEVGGGPGGFYTPDEYREIVAYAAQRGVIVVPEIDMPGHTNAALVSIPALNCDGVVPEPYTGMSVGFSSLCIGKDETYEFVDAIVGELAALTPGPYIHIGGDEADATAPADYRRFIERAAGIVRSHGKTPVGWDEIAQAEIGHDAVVQHWRSEDNARAAASKGAGVVMSPAPRAYLDMKYDESSPIGNTWAGHIDTETAYAWDPATHVPDLPTEAVVGVEAPLWTEFVTTRDEIELMMLPRLPGYAELGWSAPGDVSWDEYRHRLARHADRWTAAGRTFTADPGVPWPAG
jgi:hexosaminidase